MPRLSVRKVDEDWWSGSSSALPGLGTVQRRHRLILEEALRPSKPSFAERAPRHREALRGRVHSDRAELIREDRDRDHDDAWP
jgi:hypothetical protein